MFGDGLHIGFFSLRVVRVLLLWYNCGFELRFQWSRISSIRSGCGDVLGLRAGKSGWVKGNVRLRR